MRDSILDRAFRGEVLSGLDIVDAHCHMGPPTEFYAAKADIEEMVEDADRLGVGRLCVSPHVALSCDHRAGNRLTQEAIWKFPDRVYGLLTLNPNRPDEIDCEFAAYYPSDQFIGVKLHPGSHAYPLTGPSYDAVLERVEADGGFALVHTWEADSRCNAAACEAALQRFPRVPFIFAHALGLRTGAETTVALVNRYANAYFDTSGFEFSDTTIEWLMARVDNNKVFFGSDCPYHDLRSGISRILFADLRDELKEKLLGGNFRVLLRQYPKKV